VFFVTDFRVRKEQDDAASIRQIPQPHGVLDMETRRVTKARVKPSQSSAVLPSPDHPSQNELLTTKELSVLELVSYGYDNRAIAEYFQTSAQAVKNMMRVIHLKLGADNRAHAVAVCFRNGWFSEGENAGPGS
jgi:DNA-binding NarL/FixJ family response regulator